MTLRLDWASHAATEFACKHWHYAGVLPTGKLVKVGVWEDDFCGVVVFSAGASPHLQRKYGLDRFEVCELTRIALRAHEAPISRIGSIALKMLKRANPGLRLVVSFADPVQDHHGGVYQAMNWIYTGTSGETVEYFVDGRWRHKKGVYYGLRDAGVLERTPQRIQPGKYRYEYPLDDEMRLLCELNRLDFPKRPTVAVESAASPELAASTPQR